MKRTKLLIASASLVLATFVPVVVGGVAHASQADLGRLICNTGQEDITTEACDLTVTKQVSINGGEFVDADSADTAPTAQIGDTLIWKIRVTNSSDARLLPLGRVMVGDILPTNVTLTDVTTPFVNSYVDGVWTLPLIGEGTTLPATLLLTTTATSSGLIENTATLQGYICPGELCIDPPYIDANSTNNANSAFVNIQGPAQVLGASTSDPQVLAASTLANTGTGTGASIIAGLFAVTTLAVLGYGRVYRRKSHFKS